MKPSDQIPGGNYFELVAIRNTSRDGKAPLDGDAVTEARVQYGDGGARPEVSMSMNAEGAQTWARLTKDNIGRQVAIVLDGMVYSYPTVQGEISGGSSQITGNFTLEEAKDLANVLKSGKLPAPATIIQEWVSSLTSPSPSARQHPPTKSSRNCGKESERSASETHQKLIFHRVVINRFIKMFVTTLLLHS